MSSNVGIWSPNDLILPTVEADLDYKFFFVTESGAIDGLNITFNSGDWLVYIKKDGVGNWYKTNGGIVSFNTSSSANAPDPGYYTRVRLDNNGNIIDADYIGADDLPTHTHDIDTITGDWETKVKNFVGEMIQNSSDSSIKLTYNSSTQTISAEANLDGETLSQNEWGEITVIGGSDSSSSSTASEFTGTITIDQVTDLSDTLSGIDANIQKNFIVCNAGSGLDIKRKDEASYLSVKLDGTSIVLNSEGELSLAEGVLGTGVTDGSTTACGSHTHTSSQITDFEEAVKAIVEANANITVTDIPIDDETIIINSNGELSCVAAGTRAHTHTMSDITDLNQNIANVWASKQPLQSDQDYTTGQLNITGQTIGYAVKEINDYLKEIDTRISNLETKVSSIDVPEPNDITYATLSLTYSGEMNVVDKDTRNEVIAGLGATVETDYFYPANEGTISVYVDDNVVYTLEMDDSTKLYSSGSFKMLAIRDSYYDNSMYRGTYDSMKIRYDLSNLSEGYHEMYFRHTFNGKQHDSEKISFQLYVKSNPTIALGSYTVPSNNSYVSGIPCYSGDGKVQFTPKVLNAFTKQFINSVVYQYSLDNGSNWVTPDIATISGTTVFYDSITVYGETSSSGSIKVLERAYDVVGNEVTSSISSPSLLWNNTTVESYRVVHGRDFEDQTPSVMGSAPLNTYDSTEEIPEYEMVIQNNIGSLVRTNYSKLNGPNYSDRTSDSEGFVWCNFRFDAPFMNNVHMDVVHKDGTSFTKNTNGTLDGLKLYVSLSNTESPICWVNGNTPYPGYGSASGLNSPGLDLFKSDSTTRYITFGQRPELSSGYLYVKVGVTSNIDLGVLVDSIKESINEWS